MPLPVHVSEISNGIRSSKPALKSEQPAWTVPDSLQQFEEAGEADVLKEIIVAFVKDGVCRVEALRRAATFGQFAELRSQAHSLKGSSNQLGVPGIAFICEQIEYGVDQRTEKELGFLVDEIETIFHSITKEMLAHIATAPAG
jgi:HPt (histidine-containing phosphotransfer) domain-containing protein